MKTIVGLSLLFACASAVSAVTAVIDGPAGSIQLHDTKGLCLGEALFAQYVSHDGSLKIAGCYLANGQAVRIAFLDGDVVAAPVSAVRAPKES